MKKKTIFLILLFFEFTVYQAQTPHISGTVYLSINNGVISCDFEVSNIPEINGYSILLNTGLNVGYFSNCTDSYNYYFDKYYNSDDSYEAFQYYFPNDKDKRFLPKCFRICFRFLNVHLIGLVMKESVLINPSIQQPINTNIFNALVLSNNFNHLSRFG